MGRRDIRIKTPRLPLQVSNGDAQECFVAVRPSRSRGFNPCILIADLIIAGYYDRRLVSYCISPLCN